MEDIERRIYNLMVKLTSTERSTLREACKVWAQGNDVDPIMSYWVRVTLFREARKILATVAKV